MDRAVLLDPAHALSSDSPRTKISGCFTRLSRDTAFSRPRVLAATRYVLSSIRVASKALANRCPPAIW